MATAAIATAPAVTQRASMGIGSGCDVGDDVGCSVGEVEGLGD